MARIAFLIDNHFEQAEWVGAQQRLQAQGHQTLLISAEHTHLQGWHQQEKADIFEADQMLKDATVLDYDALVLLGGLVNANLLRLKVPAQHLVRDFLNADKPIAAIGHAAWVLISSGIVRGRTLTADPALQDDIEHAGARYLDQPVCIDHQLITSRYADDLAAFSAALHEVIAGEDHLRHPIAI